MLAIGATSQEMGAIAQTKLSDRYLENGTILAEAGDKPGVAITAIETTRLEQVRRQMPSLNHGVSAVFSKNEP